MPAESISQIPLVATVINGATDLMELSQATGNPSAPYQTKQATAQLIASALPVFSSTSAGKVPSTAGIPTSWILTAGGTWVTPPTIGALTVGTTAVGGGTSGRILYDNAGTLGELATNGSGNVLLSAGTAAITSGKTLTVSNSLTLAGVDSSTLTFGGSFTTSGAFPTTLTVTGSTNVTLPTSGTLVNSAVTALSSLVTVGTIGTGTWQGTVIGATYGGTGVNNGASTITLGGSLTLSGAFTTTLTVTAPTSLTLPTSGTLAILGANTFTALQTITQGSANTGILASTGYSLTGSSATAMVSLAGTLNTSGNPDIISLAITNTAAGATSNLLNLKAGAGGATSMFKVDMTGNVTPAGTVNLAAGTTSLSPLTFQSGTNLTAAAAGVMEYDGVQFYATQDTTGGRGAVSVEQYFHLAANGSNISTIANFFGTTSNISLVANAFYLIDIEMFYTVTGGTPTVTWTLTNSAAPTSQNIYYEMSPVAGEVAPPGTATALVGQVANDTTAAKTIVTGALTAATYYTRMRIWLKNGTGTSLLIQATASTNSITPLLGSIWRCRRISPNNIGTFHA